ncbi:MAG: Efflux ABC transporter, permease/ATP-binding protein [uncultured Acidimicrobiales bacterium]|uniref:Fatty acid ABC transporter ATP-binding/permease protein n=1 Tax=uncultured Acidimicrobiales bacterium TaxID=310071 RepID=A0A6J4IVC8_9ACTN|nr:MAG: Efflux ABC transporter, permease/ATP-binding protein [uncultured Acidimicrobiales bacterium]
MTTYTLLLVANGLALLVAAAITARSAVRRRGGGGRSGSTTPGAVPQVPGARRSVSSIERSAEGVGAPAPDDPGNAPPPSPGWRPKGAMWRSWALLPRALGYLRPYRGSVLVAILLTVVLAVAALAEPWPFALIVDGVLSRRDPPGWLGSLVGSGATELILFAVGASLTLTLVSGGFTILNEYVTTRVNEKMVLDLRSEMFQHAQRLSLAYHDDARTGILMYQINNQADAVGAIVVALPPLLQSLLTLVGMVWIMVHIDGQLALLAMTVVPLIWYGTHFYGNHIEPELYRVRGLEGRNLSIVHEAMAMLRVIVAFGREDHEYSRFRKQGEETVDARVKLTVRQTGFTLVVSFITAIGYAAVLGVGAHKVLNGDISGGQLVVVLSYVTQVYAPLELLTSSLARFQENFINLRHSFDLLDTDAEVEEAPDAVPLEGVRSGIRVEDVSFSYRTRTDTLKGISFEVPAGHAVALVGPTGAGKSTLASMLPRFYDPAGGRVCIDGHDIRDLTLSSLRAQFSIVLQEPLLFSGTIAENIGYGRPGATQAEIEEAARAANAHDFIQGLPDGYETELGERGAKISGGERQRVAVARAFLRDAPVLILDEPTSSIDSKTETVILDALERLMEGRTTIMIAHRLSTVRGVDTILVLDHGEIVQRGSHEELVEQEGLYRQLWEAQTRVRGPRRALSERMALGGGTT